MSEVKRHGISTISRDGETWDEMRENEWGNYVLYTDHVDSLAAKETEIQQLKKRISWLESGFIHTCHAECEKPLCVANREIERLKDAQAENDRLKKVMQIKDNTLEISLNLRNKVSLALLDQHEKIQQLEQQLADKDAVLEFVIKESGTSTNYNLKCRQVLQKYRKIEG